MIAVPVSLLLIFLLLYFAFNSIKYGLLIYSAIPLSAIGGILLLAFRGMPFSISAGIGFIALFGVAVLNGIVLIAEFNRLKSEGMTDVKRIVLMGTKVRLRPVLMTAFVASLGFLPMAVSNGAGAEVQRPLATVVIGGLLVATFLTLFVLPVLYMIFEKGIANNKKGKQSAVAATILAACLFASQFSFAQTTISLEAAIDTALKNNLLVKQEHLKAQYQQLLIKTSNNIPQASFIADAGQINSIYTDTKFGITQSFSFPKVYAKQKELLQQEWKSSVLNIAVKEALLKKQVAQLYQHILYLEQKRLLLQYTDSLYESFYKKAALRLTKGESNILEKTSAETQLAQINIQINQLKQDLSIFKLQFQLLLNSSTPLMPLPNNQRIALVAKDTANLLQHPALLAISQQQQIAAASVQLEKSRLLPDLSLAYNNSSIQGVGADNKFYSNSQRFNSVQVGVGIPIFAKAQKEKINSAKFSNQLALNNFSSSLQSLKSEYQTAFIQYKKYLETVQYFETNVLKNAALITETANLQLGNGIINYLEWVQLISQATTVKNEYLEAERNLNEAIIQLNYFTNK